MMGKILILCLGLFMATSSALANHQSGVRLSPKILQMLKPLRRRADFTCDNTIYVSSRPYGGANTNLFTIDPYTGRTHDIASTDQYGYDAIGFNHTDGFLYGMSNLSVSSAAMPHLIRIDPANGDITDLGTFPELANKEWILGTIVKDGTYVIGDFSTSSWLRIDLEKVEIIDGGTLPVFNPSAWAANPVDDIIYGYQSFEQKLIAFKFETHEFTLGDTVLTNVGVQPCSTAFHQDGTMFLYCKTHDPEADRMFIIDLAKQSATPISTSQALGAGDMASCAFKKSVPPGPDPEPEPKPDPKFEGTWQYGDACFTIDKDLVTVKGFEKCGPFECHKSEGTLSTYTTADATLERNTHGLIVYHNPNSRIQEVTLTDESTMNVLEMNNFGVGSAENNYVRAIYKKVKECHVKPNPKPTPTPSPRPSPRPWPTPTPKPMPSPTPSPRPTPSPSPSPSPTPHPDSTHGR
jgi:hypothetical protein